MNKSENSANIKTLFLLFCFYAILSAITLFIEPPWRCESPFEFIFDTVLLVGGIIFFAIYLCIVKIVGQKKQISKKAWKILFSIPLLLILFGFAINEIWIEGKNDGFQVITSPSGKQTAEIFYNCKMKHPTACQWCSVIRIKDENGQIETEIDTHAKGGIRKVFWESEDIIYFPSRDIGSYRWVRLAPGKWGAFSGRGVDSPYSDKTIYKPEPSFYNFKQNGNEILWITVEKKKNWSGIQFQ